MATNSRIIFIGQGVPTVVQSSLVIYDSFPQGELGALRILTHPDSDNFAPITYYLNPDRTFQLDNGVIPSPLISAPLTLTSRKAVRFERNLEDMAVTEIWEGADRSRAAMPTFLFRQLYEYFLNPPAFDPNNQKFITWQPRDRSDLTYNVELTSLTVGDGGDADETFDVDDFRLPDPVEIQNGLQSFDVSPTGLITRNVVLKMLMRGVA